MMNKEAEKKPLIEYPTVYTFKVMGKEFDPSKPEEYVKSFAIKRAT